MIAKHYARYFKNDSREQLERLFRAKAKTSETLRDGTDDEVNEDLKMKKEENGRGEWI